MSTDGHDKPGFFATLPGILTALAALVTAAGGVYAAVVVRDRQTPPEHPVAVTTSATPTPTTTPTPTPDDGTTTDPAVDDGSDLYSAALDEAFADGSVGRLEANVDELVAGTADANVQQLVAAWIDEASAAEQADLALCGQHDGEGCGRTFTDLVADCGGGDGLACDVLYVLSPSGSSLEEFGGTCGDLYTVSTAPESCQS